MRTGLVLSIVVSILIIGAAIWFRTSQTSRINPDLAVVESTSTPSGSSATSTIFGWINESPAADSINRTDLIGQQLIIDYVNLAASGQATSENVDSLANQYVSSMPGLIKTNQIGKSSLHVVDDSLNAFSSYSDSMTAILNDYQTRVQQFMPNGSTLNPAFYTGITEVGKIYSDTAESMEKIPVPGTLADLHMELINVYLSNSSVMSAIAQTESDPAKSFSGLALYQNNASQETNVLNEINQELKKHGE